MSLHDVIKQYKWDITIDIKNIPLWHSLLVAMEITGLKYNNARRVM